MSDLPNRLEDTTRAMANLCAVDMALWCNHSSAVVEAAARIRLLEQQLSTARAEVEGLKDAIELLVQYCPDGVYRCNGDKCRHPWCASCNGDEEAERNYNEARETIAAAIRSLGEPSAHPPGE